MTALVAVHHSQAATQRVLAIDLCAPPTADLGVALGAEPPDSSLGFSDWLDAAVDAPPDALARLGQELSPSLRLVSPGQVAPTVPDAPHDALQILRDTADIVVVDAGVLGAPGSNPLGGWLADAADLSILVARPCYLGLRRAQQRPHQAHGLALVSEPDRALGAADASQALGLPVLVDIAMDPAIARAVDAGLLLARIPRGLDRALQHLGVAAEAST